MRVFWMLGVGWLALAVAFTLGACTADTKPVVRDGASSPSASKAGKTVSANLTGYNHTDKTIGAFYVDGVWGGNVTQHAGGGKFVCCAELTSPWREGASVKIDWDDHEGKRHSRAVAVPKYDPQSLSTLNVHFLRNGEIQVFANRLSLWHPDYPLQGEAAQLRQGEPIIHLPREE